MFLPLEWAPILTLEAAVISVQLLLLEPSPMHVVNHEAHLLFTTDPIAFEHYIQSTYLDTDTVDYGSFGSEVL